MSNENEVITRGILKSELKIAFEDFAVIINGAFANQQKYMDGRFEKIENRLDRVETRLDKVENTLEKIEVRLGNVEYKVDVLQDEMGLVNKRQVKNEKRIEKLETATI